MLWEPKPYQQDGVKFLLEHPKAALFLDMGLGKTSISLMALKVLRSQGLVTTTLVIGPIRTLYSVWPREAQKWDQFQHFKIKNLHEQRDWIPNGSDIYTINPESFLAFVESPNWKLFNFNHLILDESSTFKASDSKRFKAIKPLLPQFKYRWILTGTPAPNGLVDLWPQMYIVDLGAALGKFVTHFRNEFCTVDWTGYNYSVLPGMRQEVYRRIAPLCMRLEAKDHLDLPELVFNDIVVELEPEARKLYKEMEDEFIIMVEDEVIMSVNSAVAGGRCRQIANGGIYGEGHVPIYVHDAKVRALKEVVDNLQGKPVLVFYEFQHDIDRIKKVMGDVPNLSSQKDPDAMIEAFNQGTIPVMLGHPTTVGLGLNLQGSCSNVVWFGVPWDLGLYDQAIARVWRQGNEADRVIVHHIVANKTLDQVVLKVLGTKSRAQRDLLDFIKSSRRTQ